MSHRCSWCCDRIDGTPYKLPGFEQFSYHLTCLNELRATQRRIDSHQRLIAKRKLRVIKGGDRSA